jgi:hypothetical protein
MVSVVVGAGVVIRDGVVVGVWGGCGGGWA